MPLVFVPGLQGRWEYARPTVDALSKWFRVITFSLCDEPAARSVFEPAKGIDTYAAQVGAALDAVGLERAAICGLSFGGRIALRFAATNPSRVDALVLASTPGPGWHLKRRHELYATLPSIFSPIFFVEAPFRAAPEIAAALASRARRRAFAWRMFVTVLTARLSPRRMAARARLIASDEVTADCARISAPTLVITGEAGLDHVVSVDGTSQYARLIAGAESVVLERTGHQGSLTRPDDFARLVRDFVRRSRHAAA